MKRTFIFSLQVVAIISFLADNQLFAQRDIRGELKQEVVKIENGVYTIQEYGVVNTFDKDFEIKISASAPVDLLSRDNFMRFYGAFSSSILATYLSQEGINVPDDLLLVLKEKPGSRTDLTVTIFMNEKGIDYVVESENSKSKMNIQWQYQIFTDPPQRN